MTPLDGAKPPDGPLAASGDVWGSPARHDIGLSADARHVLSRYGPERPVALADDGRGDPLRFKTKTDAARWLVRHGLNSATTAASWRDWPPDDLTPRGVLRLALERQRLGASDWRVTWRLHTCDDSGCVCHQLLDQ